MCVLNNKDTTIIDTSSKGMVNTYIYIYIPSCKEYNAWILRSVTEHCHKESRGRIRGVFLLRPDSR